MFALERPYLSVSWCDHPSDDDHDRHHHKMHADTLTTKTTTAAATTITDKVLTKGRVQPTQNNDQTPLSLLPDFQKVA